MELAMKYKYDCDTVEDAILRLCESPFPNPETICFRDHIESIGFLYPASYKLDERSFEALRRASMRCGSEGYLIQSALRNFDDVLEPDCVRGSWTTDTRPMIASPLESMIIDDMARWIIVFSGEDYALVAGDRVFVRGLMCELNTTALANVSRYLEERSPIPRITDFLMSLTLSERFAA